MLQPRLADATLHTANADRPGYDRDRTSPGVVHLGVGAFARGHLAVYLDDLLALGYDGAAFVGVSLRHDDVAGALNPQDGLFILGVIDGAQVAHRVIGSLRHVLHAPTEPQAVRAALGSSDTTLVTVTVTEKGYCTDPVSRRLDLDHPDVRHDLDSPEVPRSLPGLLVQAAGDRRAAGIGGTTVLSLDNLLSNGRVLESITVDLAHAIDPLLASWIAEHMRFPSSMVDRMVPATTDEFRADVAASTGVDDAWPVRAESYSQWVIERDWVGAILPLADVGVTIVDDVTPWEQLKLRVLNALHTAAAHYGLANGCEYIDQVVADPAGRAFVERVATEIGDVVAAPDGVHIEAYVATTMSRFANSGLGHRCAQVATDTSQKLPQRFPDTIRSRLERGLPINAISEVLALWAWSTLGRTATGRPRTVDDPLASLFEGIAERAAGDPSNLATALLSLEEIFGDLAGRAELIRPVTDHLTVLLERLNR